MGQRRQKYGLFRGSTPAHKMHSLLNGAKIQGFHRITSMITPGQPLISLGFRKKWTFFSLSNFEWSQNTNKNLYRGHRISLYRLGTVLRSNKVDFLRNLFPWVYEWSHYTLKICFEKNFTDNHGIPGVIWSQKWTISDKGWSNNPSRGCMEKLWSNNLINLFFFSKSLITPAEADWESINNPSRSRLEIEKNSLSLSLITPAEADEKSKKFSKSFFNNPSRGRGGKEMRFRLRRLISALFHFL
jgi:hypothetical protein